MISQEESLQDVAATDIMSLIIDVHTIMMLTAPNITGMQEAKLRLLGILEMTGLQSMTELCNQMFISKPYMTRLVDSLVSEGSVERQPDVKDRRVINISMTDEGREYLRNMLKGLRNHMISFLSGFSSSDLETICNASAEIHATFSKNPSISNQGTWSFYTSLNQNKSE
ncbi:MAG: MarR family transcriptional regulator [Methanospirillum sp.]|uniref:MarR family winged helix-turn-helix transcriptional regulator n=1 Tax=Methanospirillum sp. TaxID=45200 RepID=UPI00236E77F0|nr:MarR family transcriptional regulator [Methanospirillum sp.]MDD1729702.1 MarR family transcriptional regulator [Methanospirillum sp.]